MKLVYVKLKDPVAWKRSDVQFFEEDLPHFKCNILRIGGLLIHEDESRIVLAEIALSKDNPELEDLGLRYPRYRDVMILAKENIQDRQDFEIKEETTTQ